MVNFNIYIRTSVLYNAIHEVINMQNIKEQYNNLTLNSAKFRAFVEKMDKYSTEEIIELYDLKSDIICYCSGLSEMQASELIVFEIQHQDF